MNIEIISATKGGSESSTMTSTMPRVNKRHSENQEWSSLPTICRVKCIVENQIKYRLRKAPMHQIISFADNLLYLSYRETVKIHNPRNHQCFIRFVREVEAKRRQLKHILW